MDKQAREARKAVKNLSFSDKIRHFWEYYKFRTLAVFVAIILVGTTMYQASRREEYDLEISWYAETVLTDEERSEIESKLAEYIDDIDGDGEKKVHIAMNGGVTKGEYEVYSNVKFTAETAADEYSAYILSEEKYSSVTDNAAPGEDTGMIAFDMTKSEICREIFDIGDESVYFCCMIPQKGDDAKQERLDTYKNALKLSDVLKGE